MPLTDSLMKRIPMIHLSISQRQNVRDAGLSSSSDEPDPESDFSARRPRPRRIARKKTACKDGDGRGAPRRRVLKKRSRLRRNSSSPRDISSPELARRKKRKKRSRLEMSTARRSQTHRGESCLERRRRSGRENVEPSVTAEPRAQEQTGSKSELKRQEFWEQELDAGGDAAGSRTDSKRESDATGSVKTATVAGKKASLPKLTKRYRDEKGSGASSEAASIGEGSIMDISSPPQPSPPRPQRRMRVDTCEPPPTTEVVPPSTEEAAVRARSSTTRLGGREVLPDSRQHSDAKPTLSDAKDAQQQHHRRNCTNIRLRRETSAPPSVGNREDPAPRVCRGASLDTTAAVRKSNTDSNGVPCNRGARREQHVSSSSAGVRATPTPFGVNDGGRGKGIRDPAKLAPAGDSVERSRPPLESQDAPSCRVARVNKGARDEDDGAYWAGRGYVKLTKYDGVLRKITNGKFYVCIAEQLHDGKPYSR